MIILFLPFSYERRLKRARRSGTWLPGTRVPNRFTASTGMLLVLNLYRRGSHRSINNKRVSISGTFSMDKIEYRYSSDGRTYVSNRDHPCTGTNDSQSKESLLGVPSSHQSHNIIILVWSMIINLHMINKW